MASRSSSRSEGEIIDSNSASSDGNKKATKPLLSAKDNRVDRNSRKHNSVSRSPTPTTSHSSRSQRRNHRSRSRSPYRESRGNGAKRRRDSDDYHSKETDKHDGRKFKVHYEDKESKNAYRKDSNSDGSRHKRFRTISRSPPRFSNRKHETDDPAKRKHTSSNGSQLSEGQPVSEQNSGVVATSIRKSDTEKRQIEKNVSFKLGTKGSNDKYVLSLWQDIDTNLCIRGDAVFGSASNATKEDEQLSEVELIEQRRKRREAIKAKHRSQNSLLIQVLDPSKSAAPVDSDPNSPGTLSVTDSVGEFEPKPGTVRTHPRVDSASAVPGTPEDTSSPNSPAALDVHDDIDLAKNHVPSDQDGQLEASAADYDPTEDMQEDRLREDSRNHNHGVAAQAHNESRTVSQDIVVPEIDTTMVNDGGNDFDMFADDADDMFADIPVTNPLSKAISAPKSALDMSMLDDWDDEDGYYKIIIGELLENRYHVQMNLGKGMFSAVVRATDDQTKKVVAIKIIRSNDTMRKAALKEIDILGTLNTTDPEDKKHVIRLDRHFEHKGHLCMVFENLSINLREVLKKFGRDVGINLRAIRLYAHQMFLALSLFKKCNIIHADLKPDNILVNDTRNFLKICDLGSASDASDNEITPYLVSRFYRAPEIILGLPFDFAIDIWSIACTLYELYTGKILFTGRNNNQMLRSIMECRGKFSHKLLRKAEFASLHFDDLLQFRSVERDKITGKDVVRMLPMGGKPVRDLRSRVVTASGGDGGSRAESESREIALFVDLLDKCLALNAEKRIGPGEALRHPFILRQK